MQSVQLLFTSLVIPSQPNECFDLREFAVFLILLLLWAVDMNGEFFGTCYTTTSRVLKSLRGF
jgi:hypothetical protein